MKKLFTVDDFMVAFVSALGYGFGETIAKLSGWSNFMCILASFVLGIMLEEIISNIIFSKAVQKDSRLGKYLHAVLYYHIKNSVNPLFTELKFWSAKDFCIFFQYILMVQRCDKTVRYRIIYLHRSRIITLRKQGSNKNIGVNYCIDHRLSPLALGSCC